MKIEIRILEARDLKVTDNFEGTTDPYIKININGQMHKTTVCYRTCDPKYNQSFIFDIIPGQQITFEAFSSDEVGRDEPLGSVQHSLSYFYPGQVSDLWLPLSKKGEIHVQILSPGGLPNALGSKSMKLPSLLVQGDVLNTSTAISNQPSLNYQFFGYTPFYNDLL